MTSERKEEWMRMALAEAEKGLGKTSPNPAVGAVVLNEAEEIIAIGYHRKAGEAHAEREALASVPASEKAHTIFITLEPCSTRGRTGACTNALIDSGIKRVIYGSTDPNPEHAGVADAQLEKAGLKVERGVLREECDFLIRGFSKRMTEGRPWIISKRALSLDGSASRPPAEDQWLSSPEAKDNVQRIRKEVDAIIIGGKTARRDNPALTYRGDDPGKKPLLRIVISKQENAGLQKESQLLSDAHATHTRICRTIPQAIEIMRKEEMNAVLLESGGTLEKAFRETGLIDETVTYLTPRLTGSEKAIVQEQAPEGKQADQSSPQETATPAKRYNSDLKITKISL